MRTTFYAGTAADLIADIQSANQAGGTNSILLTAPISSPYAMTSVNNQTYGPTSLPVIATGDQLTIRTNNGTPSPGYGDTIDAAKHGRLFAIAAGASLTLENVTLQNGCVSGVGVAPNGGAIYNLGTLILSEVGVQNDAAIGWSGSGQAAAGGAIWSSGSLTVENASLFHGNSATGSNDSSVARNGGNAFGGAVYITGNADITDSTFGNNNFVQGGAGSTGSFGGSAYGGAIYIAGGTVTMNADVVGTAPNASGAKSNAARGGALGGSAYGGGVYVAGGTVTLTDDRVYYNVATGNGRPGHGGGIFIASSATVYLDSFTLAHTTNNAPDNIEGPYKLLP